MAWWSPFLCSMGARLITSTRDGRLWRAATGGSFWSGASDVPIATGSRDDVSAPARIKNKYPAGILSISFFTLLVSPSQGSIDLVRLKDPFLFALRAPSPSRSQALELSCLSKPGSDKRLCRVDCRRSDEQPADWGAAIWLAEDRKGRHTCKAAALLWGSPVVCTGERCVDDGSADNVRSRVGVGWESGRRGKRMERDRVGEGRCCIIKMVTGQRANELQAGELCVCGLLCRLVGSGGWLGGEGG
ncbi:hypothetical protein B0T16DRAFT_229814 [Cercophora newfieldiana]|uniref:Uncharacterized protein n=1 Tax=Cercophora newfieldiana TaxID=92897 RepID=A0AA39XTC1_9PEZI|nr:hypothetical protein B0T16DRAFT_229814 [Cercophora newfieldiana]